jgi:predicted PurR-regulated permease PerM
LGEQVRSITPSAVARAALVGVVALLLYQLVERAWADLLPFVVGLALAYITLPLVGWLSHFMPRQLAAIVVVILELVLLVGAIGLLVPPIVDELTTLLSNLPTADEFQARMADLRAQAALLPEGTRTFLQSGVNQASAAARSNLLQLVQGAVIVVASTVLGLLNTLGFVLALLGIPTWLVAVLTEQRAGVRAMNRVLPRQVQPDFWAVLRIIDRTFGTYVRGQLFVGLLVGVMTYVGLALLERLGIVSVRYSLVLAMIAAVAQLIPTVGPLLGVLPALAVGITTSREATLAILVLYVIVQWLQGTFIAPRIQRRSVDINPAVVVVFLVLVSPFGLLWVLLAAPLLVAARDLFQYAYGRFSDPPRPAGLLPGQPLPSAAPPRVVRRRVS